MFTILAELGILYIGEFIFQCKSILQVALFSVTQQLYEVVSFLNKNSSTMSSLKKIRPASTIRMAISGDSRCAGLYSWMKGDRLTMNQQNNGKFNNHDGSSVGNNDSPPLMLLWNRKKAPAVHKKPPPPPPTLPPMPPNVGGQGCK